MSGFCHCTPTLLIFPAGSIPCFPVLSQTSRSKTAGIGKKGKLPPNDDGTGINILPGLEDRESFGNQSRHCVWAGKIRQETGGSGHNGTETRKHHASGRKSGSAGISCLREKKPMNQLAPDQGMRMARFSRGRSRPWTAFREPSLRTKSPAVKMACQREDGGSLSRERPFQISETAIRQAIAPVTAI